MRWGNEHRWSGQLHRLGFLGTAGIHGLTDVDPMNRSGGLVQPKTTTQYGFWLEDHGLIHVFFLHVVAIITRNHSLGPYAEPSTQFLVF